MGAKAKAKQQEHDPRSPSYKRPYSKEFNGDVEDSPKKHCKGKSKASSKPSARANNATTCVVSPSRPLVASQRPNAPSPDATARTTTGAIPTSAQPPFQGTTNAPAVAQGR